MAFFTNFLFTNGARPKDFWKEQLQELVNDSFENASSVQYDVEEEDAFGTLTFHPILCRITTLVDAKTGQRVNDDYRNIIFDDLSKKPELGSRYRFDDNIWMVFSTDNIKVDTSNAYLRRCNNVITTEDKYGNIHQEPCYIDYKITETQFFKEWTMDVPQGRIQVTCQLNEHTKNLGINDRYIFNDSVYRVRNVSKFDRQSTFKENTVPTISFYAEVDNINTADRFDINVADYFEPKYKVTTKDYLEYYVGKNGKMPCQVMFGDDVLSFEDEPVLYESSDISICKVNQYNGLYECLKVGECDIYCKLYHNPNIFSKIRLNVTSVEDKPNKVIIEPNDNYIRLNQSITYSVYEYHGNDRTDTTFTFEAFDVPVNCFDIKTSDNTFTIKYNRLNDGVLKIVCTNNTTKEKTDFYIELGGVW